jgi:hypothetical protein
MPSAKEVTPPPLFPGFVMSDGSYARMGLVEVDVSPLVCRKLCPATVGHEAACEPLLLRRQVGRTYWD